MPDLRDVSVKIKNYKCFGDSPQGFDTLLPINVIIGRNNAGKSTLLELVQRVINEDLNFDPQDHRVSAVPQIILEHPLAEDELRNVFRPDTSGGGINQNHWRFGSQWIGKPLKWRLLPNQNEFVFLDPPLNLAGARESYETQLARTKRNPFKALKFRQLAAERDVIPETESDDFNLEIHGENATRILQSYLNKSYLPRELAKTNILDDLNLICSPDSVFTEIVTRQHTNKAWEIYLAERGKGLIGLSKTGSGFKTILLVLIILHLLPHREKTTLDKYIFAFEELENNLHPAMLRKLLLYVRQKAINETSVFLLTTHSNIVIDLFSKDENAQIIHVFHDTQNASAKRVTTYIDNRGILDDLDVRASDLLQANGIIWVEGPSDRVYLNKWIALWSDDALREGTHYQCVFYGGKLLAHISAEPDNDKPSSPVNILRVNRNAIVLIDSDKSQESDAINVTKKRIQNEIESIGGISWITAGRSIENYLPLGILKTLYPGTVTAVKQFEQFAEYLERIQKGLGNRFLGKKVLFAEKACELFQKDSIDGFDLKDRLNEVVGTIRNWNRLGDLTSTSG